MLLAAPTDQLGLDQFGAGVLGAAITPARVAEIVRRLVGERITVGPVPVGPGGVATAEATGRLGPVRASSAPEDPCQLAVRVPVSLAVSVRLGFQVTRFLAHATTTLALTVRPEAPLAIRIAIGEPTEDDVALRLFVPRLTGRLLAGLVDVEPELNRHVRAYVSEVLASPAAAHYTRIDLHQLIDLAWEHDLLGRP